MQKLRMGGMVELIART